MKKTKALNGTPNPQNPLITEWTSGEWKLQLITNAWYYQFTHNGIVQEAYYPTDRYSLEDMLDLLQLSS